MGCGEYKSKSFCKREALIDLSRACPGMYLADKVAFHLVITVLSLLKIVPLDGREVPDPSTIEYTDAGIR
jgi:hypothetical protein